MKYREQFQAMVDAMGVRGLQIPAVCVKVFRDDARIPDGLREYVPSGLTLTCCQAARQASLGDPVLLTASTVGCVAAAISLGLVDKHQRQPIGDSTVYTDIMKQQSGLGIQFVPPSPADFTDGAVYACRAAGRPEFALFGPQDPGRYQDQPTARRAMEDMLALEPATTEAVLFWPIDFEAIDLTPDVLVLSVRPVELTRIVQAYQFRTGRRVNASMGGLRVVDSDLIVRPLLTGEINISAYCLGARLIAKHGPDRMGLGIPEARLAEIAAGMQASQNGFPFHLYPGASDFRAAP